ncbi:MAG: hypothetical protein HUK20_12685 [Fibrobacter sp.]|nr:hypothetical protein [Fibrobacter sp.]
MSFINGKPTNEKQQPCPFKPTATDSIDVVERIKEKYAMDSLASKELNKELHSAKNEGRKVGKDVKRDAKRFLNRAEFNQKLEKYGLRIEDGRNGFMDKTEAIKISVPGKTMTISQVKLLIKGLQEAVALAQRIPSSK